MQGFLAVGVGRAMRADATTNWLCRSVIWKKSQCLRFGVSPSSRRVFASRLLRNPFRGYLELRPDSFGAFCVSGDRGSRWAINHGPVVAVACGAILSTAALDLVKPLAQIQLSVLDTICRATANADRKSYAVSVSALVNF